MQLTKRLKAIADMVPEKSRVVDVGTDHGYIPIYLTMHHIASKCIASDINQGPLDSAKRHIEKYGLTQIELRKGSGLCTVADEDEMDIVIIAGMGGLLIIDILRNQLPLVKGVKQLIIQPQNNIPEVRKFAHDNDFIIKEETFLEDEGKYYTILRLENGKECYNAPFEYIYGKYLLEQPNEAFKAWLAHKGMVFDRILEQLESADEDVRKEREDALEEEMKHYKEALKCIR